MQRVVIIDYGSGNLHSAAKASSVRPAKAGSMPHPVTADRAAVARCRPHRAAGRRRLRRLQARGSAVPGMLDALENASAARDGRFSASASACS